MSARGERRRRQLAARTGRLSIEDAHRLSEKPPTAEGSSQLRNGRTQVHIRVDGLEVP